MNRSENWIAIVGMGCRLPGGVSTPAAFQEFLARRGDGVREVPPDRWNLDAYYDADRKAPGKVYVRHAAFIDQDIYAFDPAPFGISAREADRLDPQQRLLLETTWESFADARLSLQRVRGSNTGVFIGGFMLDHQDISCSTDNQRRINAHTSTGATMTVLSNRLSYTFDLRGPSLTVDTACSSSLVAIHLASRALLSGECDLAVAGGVNVMVSPLSTIVMCKGQFLAPDGRCKAFEAGANGYGRGEGAAVVLLKRLDRALADGDRIHAVIRATGVNQDGRTDGMPMPSGGAQQALARQVLQASGTPAQQIGYVEAHGTGTRVGDPIEAAAISAVYAGGDRPALRIGSVKTNVGHLEAAAGVTALMKAVLAVKSRTILPQRSFVNPNPEIPFADLNLAVAAQQEDWPVDGEAVAAINSFGYGGTNAHAIVAAHKGPERRTFKSAAIGGFHGSTSLVPVSAFTADALRARATQIADVIDASPDAWVDVAHSLATIHADLPERAVVRADSATALSDGLRALAAGESRADVVTGRQKAGGKFMWVFTGMGPQWWAMGRTLYQTEPVYRETVDEIDRHFQELAGWSILAEMMASEEASNMHENRIAQPANFVVQAGLVALLRHFGLGPDGYLGHSVGEVAAAWASGALTLSQAVFLAYHRSQIQQQVAGKGTMLAAAISAEEAQSLIGPDDDVAIAAYNGTRSVALAGNRKQLERLADVLEGRGVFARIMGVEIAYHSPHMDPLEDAFRTQLALLRPAAPTAPLYSTVRGARVREAIHDAEYWWDNARQPVLLHEALKAAMVDGFSTFLEIGPHPVLAAAIKEAAREAGHDAAVHSTLHRKKSDTDAICGTVARLHCEGVPIDWRCHFPTADTVDLPHYPFVRERHWDESMMSRHRRLGRAGARALAEMRDEGAQPRFISDLGRPALHYLRDHVVQDAVVFPAAGYLDAALAAFAEHAGQDACVLEDVTFDQALVLRDEGTPWLASELADETITISARHDEENWTRHARARVRSHVRMGTLPNLNLDLLSAHLVEEMDPATLYRGFDRLGLQYGPSFRRITQIRYASTGDRGEVLARIRADGLDLDTSVVHPAVMDAAFQALLALLPEDRRLDAVVPISIGQLRVEAPVRGPVWVHGKATMSDQDRGTVTGQLLISDDDGRVLARIDDLVCRPVTRPREAIARMARKWLHAENWTAVEADAPSDAYAAIHQHWGIISRDWIRAEALATALRMHGARARLVESAEQALRQTLTHVAFLGAGHDPAGMGRGNDADWAVGGALLEAIQTLAPRAVQLRVVTLGAQRVPGIDESGDDVAPAQTALAGLARVAMTEHPTLATRIIDLPATIDPGAADWDTTARALCAAQAEEETAVRSGILLARRLVRPGTSENHPRRTRTREVNADEEAFELVSESPGRLESLAYRPLHRSPLRGDEIEIRVEAASLNFKDLMKAMGMLSETALERTYLGTGLGMEATGRVVRVGPDARRFQHGDRVHVYHGGSLASHVTVSERFAISTVSAHPVTDCASYFVFMTAWFAMNRAGAVQPGETVLVHSAAGGVGLACVQIAKLRGARVIATAGTEEKRAYLRDLGVRDVFDSRTLDFVDGVRTVTEGRGVDVVINALAGVAQEKSLQLLAAGGRFVELGKQDIAGNRQLGLLPFNRALTFAAVDLDRMATENPAFFAPLATEVVEAFSCGDLEPLPTEVFAAADVEQAFRRFATGKVIGKVVIDMKDARVTVRDGLTPRPLVRADCSYLVTGGLGGFGLATAQWLAQNGASHIVLASRRGRPDDLAGATIARMRRDGVDVRCEALDVGDGESVSRLMATIAHELPPLAGVFHAAMVLDDGPLATLDAASMARVFAPKARGAWLLHQATREMQLDHFVVYGSVSALVGNPNQAVYAAANAYLEGLVNLRRAQGLAGTCINWGAIADVGVVARDAATEKHLAGLGLSPLPPARALAVMGEVLREEHAVVGIIDIDWGKWMRALPETPWRRLSDMQDGSGQGEDGVIARLQKELFDLDAAALRTAVVERLRQAASQVLKTDAAAIDPATSLKDLGLDSLMAVELQVTIETTLATNFSTMELLGGRSLAALADRVLGTLGMVGANAPATTTSVGTPRDGSLPTGDATPQVANTESPAALRVRFLQRICVQPPYFALENLRQEGDWLVAEARPVAGPPQEASPVPCAEAGRHLAILGSCAASLHNPEDGQSFYPVSSSQLIAYHGTADDARMDRVVIRARCTSYDHEHGRARAETQLLDQDGNVIHVFGVDYHVIPREQFTALFAAHARPTDEASGKDPYDTWFDLPSPEKEGDAWRLDLGNVLPEMCLGHFEGHPAYPVSIMLRDATRLVAHALRAQAGDEVSFSVIGGEARTERFIFAGQPAVLSARRVDQGTGDAREQRWRCDIDTTDAHAATFEMRIRHERTTRAGEPRTRTRPTARERASIQEHRVDNRP